MDWLLTPRRFSGRKDDSSGNQEETNCFLTPFFAEESLIVEVL
jgi:hypothetical protein